MQRNNNCHVSWAKLLTAEQKMQRHGPAKRKGCK
jgi:hypothetical protein